MAETLGTLCDKLSVVNLKRYHCEDKERLESLDIQAVQLIEELDEYIADASNGLIPLTKLTFKANKIFKLEGNNIKEIKGSIATVFGKLANINCRLWHEQEKVYEFEKVPIENKNKVVKQLAILNLERTKCIDEIDGSFLKLIEKKHCNK